MAEWFRTLDLKSGGPWFNLPPYCYLESLLVVPSSTLQPCCVNSQLASLPPVEIPNSLFSHLFTISPTVLNTLDT